MKRRTFLFAAGGALVAVAGGGGAFLSTRTPRRALEPWRRVGLDEADARIDAFRHAILAPNAHNRQPWLIALDGADGATLFCDLDRRLPETDPFDRQTTISFGCFLELARMAAVARGVRLEVDAFPDGETAAALDERPVARLRFVPEAGVAPDPLFAFVARRRSAKEPFDVRRAVAPEELAALQEAAGPGAGGTLEAGRIEALRALTWQAFEVEMRTPRTHLESVRVMRLGKSEIEANPDGIDLGGPMLDTLKLVGVLSRETLADPGSSAFRQGLDKYRAVMATSMGFLWIVTPGNSRGDQLAAGAAHVRANLAAARLGLGFHPVSQALQEYAEMDGLRSELDGFVGVPAGARLQMLSRLGFHDGTLTPAPRWGLETRIRRA